jgi:hypothetical protein
MEEIMKKQLIAGVVVLAGLMVCGGRAFSAADEKFTGVLIDNTCGAKQMSKDDPEKAAAAHPASCAKKEACAKSGYALISGKTLTKLDDAGNTKAKEYFAKNDSTKVTIMGMKEGETLKVTSIEEAK